MADYVITAKKMNDAGTKVVALEVRQDFGRAFGTSDYWGRGAVTSAIEADGKTFVTATQPDGDVWRRWWPVQVVRFGEDAFLRTDGNSVKADLLDPVPDL